MSDSATPLQHTRLPCPSLSPLVCSNACPLSQWCHPTISSSVALFSSSVAPFSSSPQSFPASGSFQQLNWGFTMEFVSPVSTENQAVCYLSSVLPRAPVGIFELSVVNPEEPQASSFITWTFFPLYRPSDRPHSYPFLSASAVAAAAKSLQSCPLLALL